MELLFFFLEEYLCILVSYSYCKLLYGMSGDQPDGY